MIAPPYSIFYVGDLSMPDPPSTNLDYGGLVGSPEALTIPCQYWGDGDTELLVGPASEMPKIGAVRFEGTISTPNGVLLFWDSELTELLRVSTGSSETRLRVRTNHDRMPSRIVVEIH